jgi:CDP-paratose 2-epimerase
MGGGRENTISLLELIDLLEEFSGKRASPNLSGWRPADQKVYISDITKAKRMLGWAPEVGVREGVRKLNEWVNTNRTLFEVS